MSLCQECPQRGNCFSPCPELEVYLKEIEVPYLREKTVGLPRYQAHPWPERKKKIKKLTAREKRFCHLLVDGLTFVEIAKALKISIANAKVMATRIRKKL